MANGYAPAAPGTCGALKGDEWGWRLVRCTKPPHERGKHISEGNKTFGGIPYTAIWSDGDDHYEEWFDLKEKRRLNREATRQMKAEDALRAKSS